MIDIGSARRDIVLVVDDTPDTLSFLTDTLDLTGATVLVATDGLGALSLVEHITPDLVLMDAVMPGIDGFETCRRLKQTTSFAHVPVIFMTGLTDSAHVIRGLEAGGVDYVSKPIIVDELLARIRVHLGNARLAHSSRTALDATGRYLLSAAAGGRLLWCTPRAAQLLTELFPESGIDDHQLPAVIVERLAGLMHPAADRPSTASLTLGDRRLEFSFVSSSGADEFLFRLTDTSHGREERRLQEAFPITAREAEVLLWVSRGKANRDISEILDISPRTVNKHLEQIFIKLGVENRSSAAARAVRALAG